MKIRIRRRKITKVLEVDDTCTLTNLHRLVTELLVHEIPSEYYLSLNGKDPVISTVDNHEEQALNDNATLEECNIVSGDLIHIISLHPEESPPQQKNNQQSNSQSDSSRSHQCCAKRDIPSKSSYNDDRSTNDDENPSSCGNPEGEFEAMEPMEDDSPIDHVVVKQCLSEPLLCRECSQGRVPPLLAKVYADSSINNEYEALIVALHILMLESGYNTVQSTGSTSDSNDTDGMNKDWKKTAPGSYTLNYRHRSCPDTEIFKLICVSMPGMLILHGISPDKEDGQCQLTLKCSEYVTYTQQDVSGVYKNLPKLSMVFKDLISLPLLETYRQNHGYPVLSGIMSLSHEVKLTVLSFLDVSSINSVMSVCKDLRQISKDRYLWRRLYLKDFGNRANNDLSQDWYAIYKIEYQMRKQREKERRRHQRYITPFPPSMFRPPPDPGFPNPLPPYPPGIIGGDFDMFPQLQGPNLRRGGNNPLAPLQPRFDPIGPDLIFRPGRGGGLRDNRGLFGRGGPRFF